MSCDNGKETLTLGKELLALEVILVSLICWQSPVGRLALIEEGTSKAKEVATMNLERRVHPSTPYNCAPEWSSVDITVTASEKLGPTTRTMPSLDDGQR